MGLTTGGASAAPSHRPRQSAWPFMSTPVAAPAVDQVAGVPRRQEVEFADGSRIWLLRVEHDGAPSLFRRELGAPAAGTLVDLRQLAPELSKGLLDAPHRDRPALVHQALRARFGSVQELIEASIAVGWPA